MKYLLALGFLGMAMGDQYVRVASGTCESNGYEIILDGDECETAALALPHPNGVTGTWKSVNSWGSYVQGCKQKVQDGHQADGNIYVNTQETNHNCGYNNYDCVCKDTAAGAAGGCPSPAPSNPIDYINDQCCDCA
jgi:hypothetical protein